MKKLALSTIFALLTCLFFFADASAQVSAWGFNGNGQLGTGTTDDIYPTPFNIGQPDITALRTGEYHTISLKADGTLLAMGYNPDGRLGDGTQTDRILPVAVRNLTNIRAIAAGSDHSVALKADGTVWVWGGNSGGQLGLGPEAFETNQLLPVQVPGISNVIAVSAGENFTLALKADGTVWAWGVNTFGLTGDANTTPNILSPVQVQNLSNVIQIAAGGFHSVALKSDGTVWVWGYNPSGQVGNNTKITTGCFCQRIPTQSNISGVAQIAAGTYNTAALTPNGDVFVWGFNYHGQTGNNITGEDVLLPAQSSIAKVVELKMGGTHLLARLRDGTVKTWGANFRGQLGIGTIQNNPNDCRCQPLPVTAGAGSGNAVIAVGRLSSFAAKPAMTTNTGTNVYLTGENVRLNFANVTGAGTTSYTPIDPETDPVITGAAVPTGYTIQNNQPAYNITTTAAASGNIDVCLSAPNEYNAAEFAKLRILHREGAALVDRTYYSTYITRQVCARVTSLSPFVIAKGFAPTATRVAVSGRIVAANGRPVPRAVIYMTSADGTTRSTRSNDFGYYRFLNLGAGQNVTVHVTAKGKLFARQFITLNEDLANFDFAAIE